MDTVVTNTGKFHSYTHSSSLSLSILSLTPVTLSFFSAGRRLLVDSIKVTTSVQAANKDDVDKM